MMLIFLCCFKLQLQPWKAGHVQYSKYSTVISIVLQNWTYFFYSQSTEWNPNLRPNCLEVPKLTWPQNAEHDPLIHIHPHTKPAILRTDGFPHTLHPRRARPFRNRTTHLGAWQSERQIEQETNEQKINRKQTTQNNCVGEVLVCPPKIVYFILSPPGHPNDLHGTTHMKLVQAPLQ